MPGVRLWKLARTLMFAGLLVIAGAACEDSDPKPDDPASWTTNDPDVPTMNPSPTPEPGAERTSVLQQGTQGYVGGLRIGVQATTDEGARLDVTEGPGIDSSVDVNGKPGDSRTLDNDYEITIEDVRPSDKEEKPGEGTGSVKLTVVVPE